MSPALQMEALDVALAGTTILRGVGFRVPPGQVGVLLGPSGAGKSTVLRVLAGTVAAGAGRVWLGSTDLLSRPPHRRSIGWVQQDPLLFPHLSVAENIAFGLRVRRVPEYEVVRSVAYWAQRLELQGLDRRLPEQLSGGQQSRVALARALATEPSLLLLDEPFAHLDPPLRARLGRFVRTLQREHRITTLLVTHSREEAAQLADQVMVLIGGRCLQSGPVESVFARPADWAVADFLGWHRLCWPAGGSGNRETGSWVGFPPQRVRLGAPAAAGLPALGEHHDPRKLRGRGDAWLDLGPVTVMERWFQGAGYGLWLQRGDRGFGAELPAGEPVPALGTTVHCYVPQQALVCFDPRTGRSLPASPLQGAGEGS